MIMAGHSGMRVLSYMSRGMISLSAREKHHSAHSYALETPSYPFLPAFSSCRCIALYDIAFVPLLQHCSKRGDVFRRNVNMRFRFHRVYIFEAAGQPSLDRSVNNHVNLHVRVPYCPQLLQRILRQLEKRPSVLASRLLRRHIKHKKRQRRAIVLLDTTPDIPDNLIIEGRSIRRPEGEPVADLKRKGHSG